MSSPARSSSRCVERLLRRAIVERAFVDLLFALELRAGHSLAPFERIRLEARERLLAHLSASPSLAIRTEIAMFRQLLFDRDAQRSRDVQHSGDTRSSPWHAPMRGPYYEEGELVRHLESGDARLIARHLSLIDRSAL